MRRRDFLKAGAVVAGTSSLMARPLWADVQDHMWEGYDFGCPHVTNRLDQGPFGVTQDQGWFTIFTTQPSREHIRNFRHRFRGLHLGRERPGIAGPMWARKAGRRG